jgi:hypothetical protein
MQKMLYCNPFSINIASTDENFRNQKKEKADLIRHAKNSNNVIFISPRRIGKSSLALKVCDVTVTWSNATPERWGWNGFQLTIVSHTQRKKGMCRIPHIPFV